MHGLDKKELAVFRKLDTPQRIQDFLDRLPANFEEHGDTCMSPRRVLRERKAHCIEGALLAAAALWLAGDKPLLLDLRSVHPDFDHVVALFRRNGGWGAISKTNHAVLRYREPVYRTVRELAMSYFHEYFLDDGRKTLRSYSDPFDLSKLKDRSWLTSEKDIWDVATALDDSPHVNILGKGQVRQLRRAHPVEIAAGKLVQWRRRSGR